MPDWPPFKAAVDFLNGSVIGTTRAIGTARMGGSAVASAAWPSANRAIFIPFMVTERCVARKMVVGAGGTASGNFDVGIYNNRGDRLVNSGATAKGNAVEQIIDITDTDLPPGWYYMALAANGTNNYVAVSSSTLPLARLWGTLEMNSAYTLPATATFAARSTGYVPNIGIYLEPF